MVKVSVADTGIGMSEEFLKKVFTPFEQEDSFLSRRYEGSGLGLSISYNLIVLMGGNMSVESKPGEGSRFEFTLPLDIAEKKDEQKKEEDKSAPGCLQGKRILITDDIEINRTIVMEVLSDTGAILEEACDGEDALRKYTASPAGYYDCI
jgi:CheY-like chemotaxis protein